MAGTVRKRLTARVLTQGELGKDLIAEMYDLFQHYYAGTTAERFRTDLAEKDYIVTLFDHDDRLRGFSSVKLIPFCTGDISGRALFSGDTIIDHRFWGEQTFMLAWCDFAGRVKAEEPDSPLYWFLIVKGHRTYRYLSLFARHFYPSWKEPTPAKFQTAMDHLAGTRFGADYDRLSGLIRLPESRVYLRQKWGEVTAGLRGKPDVAYFLERNPRYHQGEELVCLTELVPANLRSFARSAFTAAYRSS